MRHLSIGGSTFARTEQCAGWIKASEKLPRGKSGPAAMSGSMQHTVQQLCQSTDYPAYETPEDCLGLVYREGADERAFEDADLATANIVFEYTNRLLDDLDIDTLLIEPFVQIVPGEAGGSIDFLGLSDDRKTLLLGDYKTGQVKVSPVNNKQLLFLAVCVWDDPATEDLYEDVEEIVFAIVQPSAKGVVSLWRCERHHIVAFRKTVLATIGEVDKANPPLHAGPECKWCPAASYCKVRKADVIAAKGLNPANKQDLQASADILEEVEAWVNATKSGLFTQLTRGASIRGWKLVDKKATRKWVDETAASAAFQKANIDPALFTRDVMLTAPQATAAFKKAKLDLDELKIDLEDHIEAKSSGTTLVPETDDREAVVTGGVPDNLVKLLGGALPKP